MSVDISYTHLGTHRYFSFKLICFVFFCFVWLLGYISLSEFSDACDLLEQHLPGTNTREQLLDMCRMMDLNKDGLVDLNEFLEAFRLCEQAKNDQVAGRTRRDKSPNREQSAAEPDEKQKADRSTSS